MIFCSYSNQYFLCLHCSESWKGTHGS